MAGPLYTAAERRLIRRLDTPVKVQRWLDGLAYNRELRGETLRTFRLVRRRRMAHCLESALSAAAILEPHGYPPILLDMESQDDLDHVVFLWLERGRFGTVAKSRDVGLGGRRPVFRTLRSLVDSYFEPYVDAKARITGYATFDLRTLRRVDWRTSSRNVWKVEQILIDIPHRTLRTSDARYERARRHYLAFQQRHAGREPADYPGRHRWL